MEGNCASRYLGLDGEMRQTFAGGDGGGAMRPRSPHRRSRRPSSMDAGAVRFRLPGAIYQQRRGGGGDREADQGLIPLLW